jgi:PST family polysaccharide transporter
VVLEKETVTKSIGWSALNKILRQLFQFAFLVVLARLLNPSEFGALTMVVVFTGLAELIKSLGFGGAIIHKQNVSDLHLNTAFWANVLMGFILFFAFVAVSKLIADFYGYKELQFYMYGVASIFLINSLNVVQESLLMKNLEFKRLFFIDIFSLIPAGIVAVLAAYSGLGTWSLIIQNAVFIVLSVFAMWFTSSWRPKFQFRWSVFKELWSYGGGLMGYQIVNYGTRNSDNLIIGKTLGSDLLGIYSRTFHLMLLPINILNLVVTRVMFPVLVKFQNDKEKFREIYLQSTALIALVIFPIAFSILLFPYEIVMLIYGSKWIAMAPILQIFAFYTIFQSINTTLPWIYNGIGKTKVLFYWGIFTLLITVGAIFAGLKWSLIGVSVSYTLAAYVILWIPGWILAFRLIDLSVVKMVKNISPYFVISTGISGLIYTIRSLFDLKVNYVGTLFIYVPLFIGLYTFILLKINDPNVLRFASIVKMKRKQKE